MAEYEKKVYIIGYPLAHSLSPEMHNAAYAALGLDYNYQKLELPELTAKTMEILRQPDCAGANVTIPHKRRAAELADELDESARLALSGGAGETGSVNTLVNRAGRLIGYSTDGAGYLAALRRDNIEPAGKKIILFGNGGAAQALSSVLKPLAAELTVITRHSPRPDIARADMVINATSVGMHPRADETILPELNGIHAGQLFSDIVYNPRETLFLRNAAARGADVQQGWGMLLMQGVLAFCLLTGLPREKAPIDIMQKVLLARLSSAK
jgi:shikimate dehydrogenase